MQIREWMDAHPQEILVIWTSKHGNTCNVGQEQFPNVSIAIKQWWWGNITEIFDGMMTDFDVTMINTTTIGEMKERNHRVVFYTSDYEEMTDSSNYALDACLIDNQLSTQAYTDGGDFYRSVFNNSQSRIAENKKRQGLYLLSMVGGASNEQIAVSAINRFTGVSLPCLNAISPLETSWCPDTLHDLAQLENYYTQRTMEEALIEGHGFPNAIYINGVDYDGTIRTGTKLPWGSVKSSDQDHQITRYAYAGALLSWNLKVACKGQKDMEAECQLLFETLESLRSAHPVDKWHDQVTGRHVDWPN